MKLLTTMLILISFNVSGQQERIIGRPDNVEWVDIKQPVGTIIMPEYKPDKPDTVKVMMLVCDTSVQNGYTWSACGYKITVRTYNNQTSLEYRPFPYVQLTGYLDYKKRKLKPSFIVWQSFEIK